MTKKLLLTLVSAVAVGTVSTRAQAPAVTPATAPGYSVTANVSAVSQYMFRGQRLGGASWQPSVEVAAGDFTAGLWSSLPFKDKVANSSDPEIDLYGSYTHTISKELNVVTGATLYVYPKAPTNAGYYRSTFEPSIALNYTIAGVKLTPKYYYDVQLSGPTYEFTAQYAYALKELGTELNFTAQGGTYRLTDAANNTSPAVKTWGDYWLLGVAVPFQLSKESKLTVGYAYTAGRDAYAKQGSTPKATNTLAVGRGVVTVSYAYAF